MTSIYDKLKQLQYGEEYPFHMPGHKRNLKIDPLLDEIAKVDITEITRRNDSRIDGWFKTDLWNRGKLSFS